MQRLFSPRGTFALLGLIALTVVFLVFAEKPQHAQERPVPKRTAKFEKFAKADAVTNDIRDRSKELVRVDFESIADREKVAGVGRIVEDFGSFAVVAKNKGTDMSRSGLKVQKLETEVHLPGSKFEPVDVPHAETVSGENNGRSGKGYFVVQFGGIARDEWLESIRDAGLEVVQYVPHGAFFVYGDQAAAARVAGHSRVRWIGGYRSEDKVPSFVKDHARNSPSSTNIYDVAVFSNLELSSIATLVGGRQRAVSRLANNFFNVVRVELSADEVERVASLEGVFRIDPFVEPTREDERAAQIVAGNFTSMTTLAGPGYNPLAQFGADGTGVTVMVSDDGISIPGNGGFYISGANTVDGPLRGATAGASGGHGHINASIIAGNSPFGVLDPLGYNYGLGIAPKANIVNIPFLKTGNTTGDAQAVDDALNTVGPNGVRATISNNSWGARTNMNAYDSLAALYDGLVRDGSAAGTIDPFTIIFSAGNCGSAVGTACEPIGGGTPQSGLTRPKVAKNIISVGNSDNLRTELSPGANWIDDLNSSSSRGPAADGRIKPDIIAPGTVITGSRAGVNCSSVSLCFDANHSYSTGTSHAAPQIAGVAALFTNYWRNSHGGAYPSPALIKAAIISTSQDMEGAFTSAVGVPNGNEGWGRVNMKFMMNTGVPMHYVNESHVFDGPGSLVAYSGTVGDATKPVRITLVWTDPPAAGDPALVNNLDLTVTVGGNSYRGNVFLNSASTTGGVADTKNNVENVFLPAGIPAGTPITITVNSIAINADGVLGNADPTDQHFSLVGYNTLIEQAPPTEPAIVDFDGDGKTDISIFRPGVGEWWYQRSSNGSTFAAAFGAGTDVVAPGDFTGDGKTDIALWRPSDGNWFVLRSEDNSFYSAPFGTAGDTPVAADYDNDGRADLAVYRASSGTWFIQRSAGGVDAIGFGNSTDIPVPGDYDGDGRTDTAIFRPSNGQWWLNRSSAGVIVAEFGTGSDRLVQGDYTDDGKTDIAFWRPSTGSWFVLRSQDFSFYSAPFGSAGDLPVPGDYDGDGKFDFAVFRPATATWFVDRSTAGVLIQNFGLPTDTPVPSVFVR